MTGRWGQRLMQSGDVLSQGGLERVAERLHGKPNPKVAILGRFHQCHGGGACAFTSPARCNVPARWPHPLSSQAAAGVLHQRARGDCGRLHRVRSGRFMSRVETCLSFCGVCGSTRANCSCRSAASVAAQPSPASSCTTCKLTTLTQLRALTEPTWSSQRLATGPTPCRYSIIAIGRSRCLQKRGRPAPLVDTECRVLRGEPTADPRRLWHRPGSRLPTERQLWRRAQFRRAGKRALVVAERHRLHHRECPACRTGGLRPAHREVCRRLQGLSQAVGRFIFPWAGAA